MFLASVTVNAETRPRLEALVLDDKNLPTAIIFVVRSAELTLLGDDNFVVAALDIGFEASKAHSRCASPVAE